MPATRVFPKIRLVLWIILTTVLSGVIGLHAQAPDSCAPIPAVKAALDELPSYATPDQTMPQFREQKMARIQALLRQYPGDLFIERTYTDFQSWTPERDQVIEHYKGLAEKNPDDARWLYLYGLTLVGRQSPEAIKLLGSAMVKDPKFAWPHLKLAAIYTAPNFLNKEKSVAEVKSFLNLCPASFEGYQQLIQSDDRGLQSASAQKLRDLLRARTDPDAVGAYRTLWSLEFKARPPAEYEPLRKQVAEDIKRIRSLNLEEKRQWYSALEEGYKLVNDQKQSDWAKAERQRRFPSMWELAAAEKWWKDQPRPTAEDPLEKRQAYYIDLLKQTEQWVKQRPNTTYIWWQRLNAMEHLEDVPLAEVQDFGERAVKVGESNAGPWGPDSDIYLNVAAVFSKKKIQPARVVELVHKGLEQLEAESKQPPYDLWAKKDNIEESNFYRSSTRLEALTFETQAYLQLGDNQKAQQELAKIDQRLPELKSLAGTKEDRMKGYSSRQVAYWRLMARLAEAEHHQLDAMAYYENALLTRLQAGIKPETGEKDELAADAQKLWTTLGGSADGWKQWYARPAAELAAKSTLTWQESNEPLPAFEIADIKGKTWQLADLRGKVVLLNVWASW
jgi:hypothetical protein